MILVTGGTGLLGSHLLFELARSGRNLRAIKRKTSDTSVVRKVFSYYSPSPDELFKRIEWYEADLTDCGAIEDSLEGVREVYHTGAVVSFYPRDHGAMQKVNTEGTANLVNASIDKGVEKFCHVSSVAALGRGTSGKPTSEEDFWIPSHRNTQYSISKYGAEREVWRGMEEGLNAVIVNPSFILGPGFWDGNSGLFRLVWNGLRYYTDAVNGYADVRDIATIMIRLMDRNIFGERFIVSGENMDYGTLFGLMARYLDKPAPSVKVTDLVISAAWRLDTAWSFLTRSSPRVSKEIAHTMRQNYTYTNDKIRKTLDFTFRQAEQTIREICGIYRMEMDPAKIQQG